MVSNLFVSLYQGRILPRPTTTVTTVVPVSKQPGSGNKMQLKSTGVVPLLPKPPPDLPPGHGQGQGGQGQLACNVKAMVLCKQCGQFCHQFCHHFCHHRSAGPSTSPPRSCR